MLAGTLSVQIARNQLFYRVIGGDAAPMATAA
jgi:hypothetical protein